MTLHVIYDFLHLLATVTWIGGVIYADLVLMPSLSAIDGPQQAKLMGVVGKRFTILAWLSVIILLVTGLLKTASGMLFDFSTGFGTILAVKHIVFLAMIVVGLLITFSVVPKLNKLAPAPGEKPSDDFLKTQKMLITLSLMNMIFGIIVLFCVALF